MQPVRSDCRGSNCGGSGNDRGVRKLGGCTHPRHPLTAGFTAWPIGYYEVPGSEGKGAIGRW